MTTKPRRPRATRRPPPTCTTTVPRLWPGSTIVCAGSGPSLCARDLQQVRATGARLVVVNDAYRLAPWADVLYAADAKWWKWHQDVPDAALPARKYTLQRTAIAYRPSVELLAWDGHAGLTTNPAYVRLGGHSGYQAINVALHLGAARIVLLGYDMQAAGDGRQHFHGAHPDGSHLKYLYRIGTFKSLQLGLGGMNIPLVNASRTTAIPASIIPRQSLEDALGP